MSGRTVSVAPNWLRHYPVVSSAVVETPKLETVRSLFSPPPFVPLTPPAALRFGTPGEQGAEHQISFVSIAKETMGNRFGKNTHNLVELIVDEKANHLAVAGYDSTCCDPDGGPNRPWYKQAHPWAGENPYRNGWECHECAQRSQPQVFAKVPIDVTSEMLDKDRLVGDAFQMGAHCAAVLRNHALNRIHEGHKLYATELGIFMEEAIESWWEQLWNEWVSDNEPLNGDVVPIDQVLDNERFVEMCQQFGFCEYGGLWDDSTYSPAYQPVFYWGDAPTNVYHLRFGCHDPDEQNDIGFVEFGRVWAEFPSAITIT